MSLCGVCGQDYLRCNCESQQPFCEQCAEDTECNFEMDSACVFYHPNQTDPPSKLTNLGMPNGSSAQSIFEAIDAFLNNNANVPITIVNTSTVTLTASGTAKHTIAAEVNLSPDFNNQLEIRNNGLYSRPYNENFWVKVNAADAPDYLENQITGGTDGIISINTFVESGKVKVQPMLDIQCLINAIRDNYLEEFCAIAEKCNCFLIVQNFEAVISPGCPDGYTLNDAGTLCVSEQTEDPEISETLITACESRSNAWNAFGALLYTSYKNDGRGPAADTTNNLDDDLASGDVIAINTTNVWQNVAHAGSGTATDLDGPLNRAGIWACDEFGDPDNTYVGTLGFVVPVEVASTKIYYVGISGDNNVKISVTLPGGSPTLVVETRHNSSSDYEDYYDNSTPLSGQGIFMPFRVWHLYPVLLQAGVNYIEITGTNDGSVGGYAAEIYNATVAELQAAALKPAFTSDPNNFPYDQNPYSNIDLVFSTRCAKTSGTTFSVGNATCQDSTWTLDTSGGQPLVAPCQGINVSPDDWVCRKTVSAAFTGYAVDLAWDRVNNANSYTIQYKPQSDPDSSFTAVTGSPVDNPNSGSTVTLNVPSIPTNQVEFRIRANFPTCSTPWTIADNEDICHAVVLGDVTLPDGVVGSPYFAQIPILEGTAPFTLTNVVKPSWMTIAPSALIVFITGTPDVATSGTTVSFTINNCSGSTDTFADTIVVTDEPSNPDPLIAQVRFDCINPPGGDGGCDSQSHTQVEFFLDDPLTSPLTMKVGVIDSQGSFRAKWGQDLIPSVPADYNVWGDGTPATITIPAGVTYYKTFVTGQPNNSTFIFGGSFPITHTCFETCNSLYNSANRIKEFYMQVQAPNASITLQFTPLVNSYTGSDTQFIQI